MPASSGAHLANLGQDWDAFFASKRSGATRKRERRQFQNLAKYGEVRFAEPTETAEIERTLAVLFEQKAASFARLGIENFLTRPGHREFFADLATSGAGGLSHVSRLDVGETWAATNFGLEFRGRYYLLISSYEHGELSRFGLGRAHIQALMRRAIEHGLREFDFTIGDEAYKLDWSDTKIALYGHFAAMRLRGMPAVLGFAAFRHAKRTIKQNPVLWRLYRQARERLRRVRSM
jgi:CelD/BcsL family acetyltransferase involved in cellulose biosynthesis